MKSFREDPDGEASQEATKQNMREAFALLRMSAQQHILITPATCTCDKTSDHTCVVCDMGLAVCSRCGKAEEELDQPCLA